MKKAVLVGINDYRSAPLRGCLNDVIVMQQILTKKFHFDNKGIVILTDQEATKRNIIASIKWLTQNVDEDDSIVFHYSGHGSQVSVDDRTSTDEIDGRDEILCPFDLDWNDPLRDHELGALFKKVPKSCNTLIVLDNCHSGSGLRGNSNNDDEDVVNRFLPPPISNVLSNPSVIVKEDLSFDFPKPKDDPRATRYPFLNETAEQGGAILLAGCQENQTSADAWINNRYQGAMTYALAYTLSQANYDITYEDLIKRINDFMDRAGYTQNPQLECKKEYFNKKFLK